MIDVYSWTTGNARKVYIMLEETGLSYRVHPINIAKGDQFGADFLKISPNNKIPAIVDRDGPGGEPFSLFESGAILMYLAEKTGRFLPDEARLRQETIMWLVFQVADQGPMFGQAGHFVTGTRPGLKAGRAEFIHQADHVMRVLDQRFAAHEYVNGADYSIADMMLFPWCQQPDKRGLDHADYPNLKRWFDRVAARPAVQRADEVCEEIRAAAKTAAE